jgi:uncharacterized Zn-finger protein
MIRTILLFFLALPVFVSGAKYIAVDEAARESAYAAVTVLLGKEVICPECDIAVDGALMLVAHMSRVHPEIRNRFMCCCCPARFSHRGHFQDHLEWHHVNVRPYRCLYDECGYAAKRLSDMKSHQAVVHGVKAREFPCLVPGCGKVFKRAGQLNQHICIVHEQIKKYSCSECNQLFSTRGNLKKHIQSSGHSAVCLQEAAVASVLEGLELANKRVHV